MLEKHWSSRTFSLFSSASFLGQSDPPPPAQPPPREDVCWFSELQERERRPSEHHSLGGEPCSHPSCTLSGEEGGGGRAVSKPLITDQLLYSYLKTLTHLSCLFLEAKALCSSSIMQLGGMGGCIILPRCGDPEELSRGPRSGRVIEDKHSVALCGGSLGR